MSIFQKAYDFIKGIKTPKWLVEVLRYIQDNVLIPSLQKMGELAWAELQRVVIKASKMDVSNQKKFDYVYAEIKKNASFKNVKDSFLNLSIEIVVNDLKSKGII